MKRKFDLQDYVDLSVGTEILVNGKIVLIENNEKQSKYTVCWQDGRQISYPKQYITHSINPPENINDQETIIKNTINVDEMEMDEIISNNIYEENQEYVNILYFLSIF